MSVVGLVSSALRLRIAEILNGRVPSPSPERSTMGGKEEHIRPLCPSKHLQDTLYHLRGDVEPCGSEELVGVEDADSSGFPDSALV